VGAERVIAGFQAHDPRLVSFLDDFALVSEAEPPKSPKELPDVMNLALRAALK